MNNVTCAVSLSRVIKQRRNRLGLKQQQIADALQVVPEAVGHWERGSRRIELDKLPRLAAILQLNEQDVCRIALHEFHPCLYHALYGTEPPGEPQAA